ncbi:MAG: 50S ribosomal protein L34 [Parcubacteria group bacterium SW_4_49_11]|nr:MAG: 50S ribosomal protein L34 [Parcubacteria group bacterium SW_4_49_11]
MKTRNRVTKKRKHQKTHGFLRRMRLYKQGKSNVIKRRRKKGRHELTA